MDRIQTFIDEYLAADSRTADDPDASARCAAAALLLEMPHMDDTMAPVEQAAIFNAVRESFNLSPEQTEELIACAQAEREQATDYHQFTSLITANFDAAQRVNLIQRLWQVAYADKVLCKLEEYQVRKVANLLHVPHSVFISTKLRAMDGRQDRTAPGVQEGQKRAASDRPISAAGSRSSS